HWRTSARRGELMVREFEDVPGENLVLVFAPPPLRIADCGSRIEDSANPQSAIHDPQSFERAVGLTASIVWEWCRQHGDRLVRAPAAPAPRPLGGRPGPEHARRVLECLALVAPGRMGDPSTLTAPLAATALPPGPVLVIGVGPNALAASLPPALGRPVTG